MSPNHGRGQGPRQNRGGQGNTGHRQGGRGRGRGRGGAGGNNGGRVGAGGGTDISGNTTPCGMCSEPTSDDAIGCDSCSSWYHPTTSCTGLQSDTLRCIHAEGGNAVRFVCSGCRCTPRNPASGSSSNISAEALSQLYAMVKSVIGTVTDLTKQVGVLVTRVEGGISRQNPDPASTSFRDEVREGIRELDERKKRKDSLFVRGISARNDGEFTDTFKHVCRSITGNTITPDSVTCINRDKKLYRAKVSNFDDRNKILASAKDLRENSEFDTVFISRDLTYQQRQERRLRRGPSRNDDSVHPDNVPVPSPDVPAAADNVPDPSPARRLRSSSLNANASSSAGAGSSNFQ